MSALTDQVNVEIANHVTTYPQSAMRQQTAKDIAFFYSKGQTDALIAAIMRAGIIAETDHFTNGTDLTEAYNAAYAAQPKV